ncbi:COG4223 family protein [Pseudogemmobacter bohemicus]|uniref:COG4223 family protein n=1 Tax=Pseudogemmobacter bohemicus TaxID=2250708 RepID=UPI000DD34BF9|nr:hypothetical protein [Pseudogemmobacter bohemicus]
MAEEEKPAPVPENAGAAVPEPVLAQEPLAEPVVEPALAQEAGEPADTGIHRPQPLRRGGFVAPFLGGVAAAALGFGLSHFNVFGLRADLDTAAITADIARLETQITSQAGTTAAALAKAGDAAAAANSAVGATDEKLAALVTRLDGLDQQIRAQAEALPDGTIPPAAFAALKAEVDALKAAPAGPLDADALRQQIEAGLDARAAEVAAEAERTAEATRQAALHDAAWIALNEAVKNGQPYADSLTALGATGVPEALAAHAATGLPGVTQLTESFPEAARLALEASLRADEGGGFGDRALSLLRVTTGQRSLTPQEGPDPDAVLSRAEAAVQAGDLPAALSELQGLPPDGQAAMAPWVAQAQARIDAEAALAALKP